MTNLRCVQLRVQELERQHATLDVTTSDDKPPAASTDPGNEAGGSGDVASASEDASQKQPGSRFSRANPRKSAK